MKLLLALFAIAIIAVGCRDLTPYPVLEADDETCDSDAGLCDSADAGTD